MAESPLFLIEEDYAAAKQVAKQDERLNGRRFTDDQIRVLAGSHAILGRRLFELQYGLRQPIHDFDQLDLELVDHRISEVEYLQMCQEIEDRPLTLAVMSGAVADLEEHLVWYDRFWQAIRTAASNVSTNLFRYLSRCADEMIRRVGVPFQQLHRLSELLTEARVRQNLGIVLIGEESGPTVCDLIQTIIQQASDRWKTVLSAPEFRANPIQEFRSSYGQTGLPARTLQTLLHEEFAIGRMYLREQIDNSSPLESHSQVEIGGDAARSSTKRKGRNPVASTCGPSADGPHGTIPPKLTNWAVGYELGRTWRLFHRSSGRWDVRMKIQPFGRLEHAVLSCFAESGGVATGEELNSVIRNFDSRIFTSHELKSARKSALKRIRTKIKGAIAKASKCDDKIVGNPIPPDGDCWRATIQIGYVTSGDNGEPEFKSKEDMTIFDERPGA